MSKLTGRQDEGPWATGGFRGGNGRPGYPVPDVLKYKDEEDAVLEDLVARVILGLSKKQDIEEFVETAEDSGLVKALKIDGIMGEIDDTGIDGVLGEATWPEPDMLATKLPEIPVTQIPAGTIVYHGTSAASEKLENRPMSVTTSPKHAKFYADTEHTGDDKHVIKFSTKRIPKIISMPSTSDKAFRSAVYWLDRHTGEKRLFTDLGYGRPGIEAWKALANLGFDGLYIRRINSGGDELVLFDPTKYLEIEEKIRESLDEAESPEKLHKGIQHLEDLKPDEFITFLKKFKSLPLDGGLEVSEKVDGSARISFGIENGKIWTQSKNGPKRTDVSQYEDIPMYRAIRAAHKALQGSVAGIKAWWPKNITFMVAEVLYTKIPNSIEYGPNVVMVHGVHKSDGSVVSDSEAKKIVDVMTKAVGKKLNDGKDEWIFEYKRIVNPSDVMVDVKEEFTSISQIYDSLKKLEPDKLKNAGKVPYKATLERFKAIQLALKKKLLSQLRKQKSVYGPEGGDVEGLVFRDLESGALTKLVDKEYFTKINKFLWYYRELLDKGVKVGDKWEVGIMQKLRNSIADKVLGSPVAKTPGFVQQLAKFGVALDTGNVSDEQRVDMVLSEYIKKNNLMQGDFVQGFKEELNAARQAFTSLMAEWEKKGRRGTLSHTVKDDDGKAIKKITMDPLIKQRTTEAFDAMNETLAGIGAAVEAVWSIDDEQTRKVALLKVFLGSNRLEKLQGQLVGGTGDVNEADGGAEYMSPHRALLKNNNAEIVAKFADKLAKRGIKVPKDLKSLGVGSMAAAFDIGDDKILKVTGDVSDAQAALKVKGKNLKHVVNVYDVFEFPKTEKGTRFGIVSDKLAPMAGTGRSPMQASGKAKQFNAMVNDTFLHVSLEYIDGPKTFKNVFKQMLLNLRAEQATQGHAGSKEMQEKFVAGMELLRSYGIPEMMDELEANGIDFHDYHANNIMFKKNGMPAVIDLGYSKTQNGKSPDMLEKKKLKEDLANPSMYKGIVKRHAGELAKRNIKVGNEMGSGANGMVFDIGGNKVLKVTIDEDEASSSNHIKGKTLKHVVHIYDVFQFKTNPNNEGDFFGIVQEKLAPLPKNVSDEIEEALNTLDVLTTDVGVDWIGPQMMKDLKRAFDKIQDPTEKRELARCVAILKKHDVLSVMDELISHDISWYDMHQDNLMKRGSDIVAVDLGTSDSPGALPHAIESAVVSNVLGSLRENKADKVGVTIGRFQPFHRGHAEMIRDLAKRYNKVVVIVAGNSKDKKNPFSYETRLDLMKRSLPDVMSKVEVHKAQFGGKGSGYIPGILSEIINTASSSVDAGTAVTILVGEDRFAEIQKQIAHARGLKANGTELSFDPDMAMVEKLADVKNDDEAERVSGTRVREALAADDRKSVEKMMDPHLIANPADFEELYAKMKSELSAGKPSKKLGKVVEEVISELISDAGGADGIAAIVQANAEKLKNSKFKIDLANVKPLGSGKEGVAFDIGNGKVLKVTTDEDEAMTSVLLIGKNMTHVVRVYDVFRFGNTPNVTVPVYGIITERLTALSQSESDEYDKELERIETALGDNKKFLDAIWTGKFENVVEMFKIEFAKDISAESGGRLQVNDQKVLKLVGMRMAEPLAFFAKYKFKEMMEDLSSLGIKFADYHGGNVMKRGSDYVINDIGRSESPSSSKPRNLESKIIEAVIDEMSFSGPGGTQVGMKAGSSSWSSQMNTVDPNSHEMWQDSLVNLQQHSTGSIDTDMS